MAELKITKQTLTVSLSWWERLSARRSHLTVPRRAIRSIEVVDDVLNSTHVPGDKANRGIIRIPGVFLAGTRAYGVVNNNVRQSEFSVCRKSDPGLVIELENVSIGRIVISTKNAQQYASELAKV